MVALRDVLQVVPGWSIDQIESLLRRNIFKSEFGPSKRGRARELTRENSLEAAFVYALVLAKLPTDEAATRAAQWIEEARSSSFQPFYVLNPATTFGTGFSNQDLTVAQLANMAPDRRGGSGWAGDLDVRSNQDLAVAITIINRAEIVRRVDALFSKHSEA